MAFFLHMGFSLRNKDCDSTVNILFMELNCFWKKRDTKSDEGFFQCYDSFIWQDIVKDTMNLYLKTNTILYVKQIYIKI